MRCVCRLPEEFNLRSTKKVMFLRSSEICKYFLCNLHLCLLVLCFVVHVSYRLKFYRLKFNSLNAFTMVAYLHFQHSIALHLSEAL